MLNNCRQHGTGRKHSRTSTKLRRWLGAIPFQLENRDVPAGLFLQGQSYIDVNENGKLDLGEPYLPGAVVELRSQDGSALIASTTTDATGAYLFNDANVPGGLLPGTYRLVETPPAGYLNTPTPNQAAVSASWPFGTATQLNPATIQVTLSDWNNPANPPLALNFLSTGDIASLQMTLTNPLPILPNNNGAFTYDFVGELNLRLTGDDLAQPVDFLTYCLDLTRLLPNPPATGQVIPRSEPVPPNLSANAGRIAYLYNEYGAAGFLNGAASALFAGQGIADSGVLPPAAEDAAAFQLALWELCYDVGTPAKPEGDLEAGNFFFRAVAGQPDFSTDPASVAVRQKAYAFLRDSLGKSEQAIFLDGSVSNTQLTIISGSLNFGNVRGASIAGVKFNDVNGDGVRQAGESGLQGWTIQLLSTTDVVLATTTTDAAGNYAFTDLAAGTYRVREVGQAGWIQTTVNPGDVAVVSGTDITGVDFGNFRLGRLAGVKFNDVNGDGVRQAGEPGLAGWTIELDQGADGTVDATTTTDAAGNYAFDGLAAGTYRVREVGQTGWVQTTVNPGDVTVVSGTVATGLDFGNFRLGAISGVKFADTNGNGVRDAGESGLAGWTIQLLSAADVVLATTTTAADGSYTFAGLAAGTYRVREVGQTGWVQTTVNPGDVTVVSGTTVTGLNIGNFQLGRLSGQKFEDVNGDGVREAGEPGLAGWTIELDRGADGTVDATTTTAADGSYAFDGLMAGTYRVREVGRSGWVQTTVNPGDVTIISGSAATGVDFGNFQLGRLAGAKFDDVNGDGVRQADEPGLQGWTIQLLNTAGAVLATTTTDAAGNYAFDGLAAGTYRVREVGQTGWVQTTVNPGDVTVVSGTVATGLDFGNTQLESGGGGGGQAPELPLVRPIVLAPEIVPITQVSKRDLLASTLEVRTAGEKAVPARQTTADFNRDGIADSVVATGPGVPSFVRVFDGATGAVLAQFSPFESSFTGGLLVTTGDLTGDGVPDLVVAADQGGGPRVQVYSGAGFGLAFDFFALADPNFRGGVRPAVGDVNGDGVQDLVVAAGFGGGPRVTVWNGAALRAGAPAPLADFFAFEPALRNGAFVAAGDVDGDGASDLILGGGPGGGPRVRVVSGRDLIAAGPFSTLDQIAATAQIANFFAGDPASRDGARVAFWDTNGDGHGEVVTGSGPGGTSDVRSYTTADLLADPSNPTAPQDLDALFGTSQFSAVFVG
jgi:serine-aspartate repeat-containing protein C/D/E